MSETGGPPYNDPREAAIAMEIIERNVDAIVEDYVPGDKNNLGNQILNTWLITDKKRIKPVTLLANRHRYFRENGIAPHFAKTIIANVAEKLHTEKLMQEGMSSDEARVRAKEFRKERTSLVHERLSEKLGSKHFSEKSKLQDSAWPQERTIALLQMVADPTYRRPAGIHKGRPDWNTIAENLGIGSKAVKDHYDSVRKNIKSGIANPEIVEYAQQVGIYTPKERVDWSTFIPNVMGLIKTDKNRFVWQEGANKNSPNWMEIIRQLESEGKLPFSIDWNNAKQIKKYASEMSNAYKKRTRNP